jgi:TPR repeat protein
MTKMEELLKQQQEIVAAIEAEFERGREAAAKGEADAQYNLGVMHYKGQGVKQNYQKAMNCFKLAAEQDNESAQIHLGAMYYRGEGTEQDYAEAMHWYNLAAEKGTCSREVENRVYVRQRARHKTRLPGGATLVQVGCAAGGR